MVPKAQKSWSVSHTPMSSDMAAHKILVVNSLVDYLRPRFDPNRDTIQMLDEAEGGYHALFILRAVQPTRYISDVEFLHNFQTPYARRLMADFLAGLRQKRPKYIVVFNYEGFGAFGPDRLQREFPEVARLIAESYTLEHSAGIYFVYGRK